MTTELRARSQAQQIYTRALSAAWRNGVQVYNPSVWAMRDPEVEEKMLRDADIAHAVGYRRHLIAGRQWQLAPKVKGSPRSDMAVAVGTGLFEELADFTGARLNLARAFFSGSRFARIHGVTRQLPLGDGRTRTWWLPVRLEDQDNRTHRQVAKVDGEQIAAHWEHWHVGASEWRVTTAADAIDIIRHVYQDDQATLGHGRALREALGWWWYAKEHVFQESLQAVERFAQGILHAKVDGVRDAATGLPNDELIAAWRDVLEDLRSRHVLVSDAGDSVEVIPGSSEGWQMLSDIRAELRATIFSLVLGANLTTAASEGGSYALAEIQENSTEALIQYDRETLEETLTKQLLGCIWWHNHANLVELDVLAEKPRFTITQEKKTDPQVRATVAESLHRMGVAIAADDLYEQTGFRKPQDGEDVIAGAVAPAVGGAFGDPSPNSGFPFRRSATAP